MQISSTFGFKKLGFSVVLGTILVAGIFSHLNAQGDKMQTVVKKSELKAVKGDSKIFSGEVKVSQIFAGADFRPFSGGLVEFSKGARSAWHTHPAGQTLIVVEGKIYTGTRDGVTHIALKGDTILCPPDLEHWHGAGLDESGSHIALTGIKDGKNVTWLEKVSEAEYQKAIKNAK